jgi:hypothetical protein
MVKEEDLAYVRLATDFSWEVFQLFYEIAEPLFLKVWRADE